MLKNTVRLVGFIAGCLAIGWLGSLATRTSVGGWYAQLNRPPLSPPSVVFAPAWTVLYVLMAIAGWRLWTIPTPSSRRLKILFGLQLVFNAVWSFLFFGLQNPLAGLADIVPLWLSIAILLRLCWREERVSALLLTPYLAWVSFATYLNAGYWWLNR